MQNFGDRPPLHVLIVEDEWSVREMLADVLDEAGFVTRAAICATEAWRRLPQEPDIDVVITDIEMPGPLDGMDLARLLAAQRPEIGVLIVSGGRPRLLPPGALFLAKPFTPAEVLRALGELAQAAPFHAS